MSDEKPVGGFSEATEMFSARMDAVRKSSEAWSREATAAWVRFGDEMRAAARAVGVHAREAPEVARQA